MSPEDVQTKVEQAWRAARAAPLDAGPWAGLCVTCLQAGDAEGAAEALEHLEAMSLGDATLWRALAERLEAEGQWAEAYRAWRRVVEDAPHHAEPYRRLAGALSKGGELELALVALETALRLAPGDAVTHRMLARAHHARGRLERARAHARRARALEPDHPSMTSLERALGALGTDGPPPLPKE